MFDREPRSPLSRSLPRVSLESDPAAGALRDNWTLVNGLPMYARVSVSQSPDAPTFILVHGLGVSGRYLVPTAQQLARFGRVYVPDIPGFGKSLPPPGVLSVPGQADVIADWMDVMGLESAIFLGNSLGCQVIVQLALRHPGRVRCGILVGPTFDASARDTLQQAWRLFLDTLREPLALNWINFSDYISAGPLRVWRTFQNGLHQPETANLTRVDVPVLVVRGGIDPIVPQEWAERVADLLPHGRLVVIPEAPHAVNFSHPVELVQAVCDFLQDIGEWQPG